MVRALFGLALVLASCGGASSSSTETTGTGETTTGTGEATSAPAGAGSAPDGRHWIPDGFTRSPTACTVDADCTADTLPDVASPCCNDPRTLEAYSVAWDQAVQRWRDASCASVTCPPPPAPMLPERCRLTARCAEGTCADSCP